MSSKKFCMECAGELIVSADGALGICSKCGKTYTFTDAPVAQTETRQTGVAEEYKSKVDALMELGKKEEAIKTADEFLEKHPDDYRAYLLRGALEVELYKLDPVDAVIERKWEEFREKLEQSMKIATKEQLAFIKEECGEYCKRAENVVQIFYDLHQKKKADSAPPTAPTDSTKVLSANCEIVEQKVSSSEEKLSALQKEKLLEESNDEVQKLREQPPTATGLFAKAKIKKLLKARERLYALMESQKVYRLKKLSEAIAEEEKALKQEKENLAELNKKLENQKAKYQTALERYEKELAEYQNVVASREEKERLYASDPTAQAILKKLVAIEEKMAEYQEEINRLNKESKPFSYKSNGSTFDSTEYYLQQATYRQREQRLTSEKIQITGKINDLRFMLIAHKPKAPLFEN